MDLTDAKPCPFCGKSPIIVHFDNDKYTVECMECKVIMGIRLYGGVDLETNLDEGLRLFFDTKDEAIMSWNTRGGVRPEGMQPTPAASEREEKNETKDDNYRRSFMSIPRADYRFRAFLDVKEAREKMVETILSCFAEWIKKVLPEYKDTLEKYLYLIPDSEYEEE